jgi:hypothetical protein
MLLALLGILGIAAFIAQFVCWIIVLTKLFPAEGALKGVFAVICNIYALIWGWLNVSRYNLQKVMIIWSVAFATSIVVQIISIIVAASVSNTVPSTTP